MAANEAARASDNDHAIMGFSIHHVASVSGIQGSIRYLRVASTTVDTAHSPVHKDEENGPESVLANYGAGPVDTADDVTGPCASAARNVESRRSVRSSIALPDADTVSEVDSAASSA